MTAPIPDSFLQKVGKLIDRKIQDFARSGFLRNASVSGGGIFTILGGGIFKFQDSKGDTLLTNDTVSGEGLANPWIPLGQPAATSYALWPNTTSSSATSIAEHLCHMQHPKVWWNATAYTEAGTSGSVHLLINGTTAGQTWTVGTNGTTFIDEVITLPAGFYGNAWNVQVVANTTGGSGAIRVQTWALVGRQS